MGLKFAPSKGDGLRKANRAARKHLHADGLTCRAEALETRQLLSTSWFVSPAGSNQNPGTIDAPLQTIQAAANVAQPGDYVEIEAGTYHEDVIPKYSGSTTAPIVYEAYNHEDVTVSGADAVTNWTTYAGDVYQSPMPWDLGEGNNQVFVDGQAINEARWPNTSLDLMNPTLATATKVSYRGRSVTLYDADLTQPANFWQGAIIHILPGQGWVAETCPVTSSAPGSITFTFASASSFASYTNPAAGNTFYLTNSFKSLDSNGEWYRDPATSTLYMATPAGDDPTTHDIEVKHRAYAFDLTSKSYTTIQGINIFSATIRTTTNSFKDVINSIHAVYISQFLSLPTLWYAPSTTGIMLNGGDDVLENSTIAFSAGDGVIATGPGTRITNNLIHDVDYSGSDTAAIRDYASSSEIDHNTIYNTGRSGIVQEAPHIQVLYNTLHNIGTVVTEAGGIYTVGLNGQGTVVAYNTIYDMHSGGYGQTALFLDNNSSGYTLHDNVVSDVDVALKLNMNSESNKIYNNTLSGTQNTVFGNYIGSWGGTSIYNNILIGKVRFGAGASSKNNATTTGVAGTGAASFTSGISSDIVEIPVGVPPPPPPPPPVPVVVAPTDPSTTTGDGTTPADPTTTDPSPVASSAPTSVTDISTEVTNDRAAIVDDTETRKADLAQMAAAVQSDVVAYQAANHQLAAARRKETHAKANTVAPADVSSLDVQVEQLLQKIKTDKAALTLDHHTDFTGIHAAHAKLATDLKSLATARRTARKA